MHVLIQTVKLCYTGYGEACVKTYTYFSMNYDT